MHLRLKSYKMDTPIDGDWDAKPQLKTNAVYIGDCLIEARSAVDMSPIINTTLQTLE